MGEDRHTCCICIQPIHTEAATWECQRCHHHTHYLCIIHLVEIDSYCPYCREDWHRVPPLENGRHRVYMRRARRAWFNDETMPRMGSPPVEVLIQAETSDDEISSYGDPVEDPISESTWSDSDLEPIIQDRRCSVHNNHPGKLLCRKYSGPGRIRRAVLPDNTSRWEHYGND